MRLFNRLIAAVFFTLLFIHSFSQVSQPEEVSEEKLMQHVVYLASDSLKGRGLGTPEADSAAAYLTNTLKEMELAPPAFGYAQQFVLSSRNPDRKNTFIKLHNNKGKELFSTSNLFAYGQISESLILEGDLIFAGFGTRNQWASDSTTMISLVKDKIVLYAAGSPAAFRAGRSENWDIEAEMKKIKALLKAGAKAIIIATSHFDTTHEVYNKLKRNSERQARSTKFTNNIQDLPVFIVTPEVAEGITGKSLKWEAALQTVAESEHTEPLLLNNNRVTIQSKQSMQLFDAANIIGIVEGSDPELKKECLVFIAHYDHLGVGKNGEVFNGADDNASGVATLLEVARLFAGLDKKPDRSLVFLFPAAEEVGLFGSEFYSRNPVFPIEKTVACINLDMVGRVYEPRDSVWANSAKPVKDFAGIYALVNEFNPHLKEIARQASEQTCLSPDFSLPGRFFYTSDHYHFHKNKVPVVNLSTGYSADYHKTTDTSDRIRPDKMKAVARLCYIIGMKLGNKEQNNTGMNTIFDH